MIVTRDGLCTVQTVVELHPHSNADRLQIMETSEGWRVCVPIGFYSVGDSIIHAMPDTMLLANEAYAYLSKGNERVVGDKTFYRVRQSKIRGEVSQGVVLSPASLGIDLPAGTDVTDQLGAMKYQKPVPNDGESVGGFPSKLKKTDEDNFQKVNWKGMTGSPAFVTEKLDGSSMTCAITDGKFRLFSRNLEKDPVGMSNFAQVVREYDLEPKVRKVGELLGLVDFSVQGELVGPGVQGNPLGLVTPEFRPFNVWDVDTMSYVSQYLSLEAIAEAGMRHVPIIVPGDRIFVLESASDLRAFATGDYTEAPGVPREGMVFSFSKLGDPTRVDNSFKVINPQYED